MKTYTMRMDEKFEQTLQELARGSSFADVIRNAVSTYQYLKTTAPAGGPNHVSISDGNNVVQEIVELP